MCCIALRCVVSIVALSCFRIFENENSEISSSAREEIFLCRWSLMFVISRQQHNRCSCAMACLVQKDPAAQWCRQIEEEWQMYCAPPLKCSRERRIIIAAACSERYCSWRGGYLLRFAVFAHVRRLVLRIRDLRIR